MPSDKTVGILVAAGLLAMAVVVAVLNGLADSISRFLYNLGMPMEYASDINSVVFFGGLFLVIVLTIKTLPPLSRV